jgi:branched-chain amino acid transport system permease protein
VTATVAPEARVTTRKVDDVSRRARTLTSAAITAGLIVAGVVLGELASVLLSDDHGRVPLLVQVDALVVGMPQAAFAVALVLVYRSARVINFSLIAFAGAGAIGFAYLHQERGWPYYLAMLAGIAISGAFGFAFEIALVRRFFHAPRLVLTVITIAMAQALLDVPNLISKNLVKRGGTDVPPVISPAAMPSKLVKGLRIESLHLPWSEPISGVITGDEVFLAGACLLAITALACFLRFTPAGVAIRGAAENADRAALFGINVAWLSTLVWTSASLLGGVAYVTQVPVAGLQGLPLGLGGGVLLRGLAAAVFARMESLPRAAAAALGFAVFEASVFYASGSTAIVDLVVFAAVLGGLLAQRNKLQRAQASQSGTWASTEEIRPTPPQLAGLPAVLRGKRWVAFVAAVFLLGYPWIASPSQTFTGSLFAIYGIVAVSLVVLTGWGGQISLGQWGFAGIGALVCGGASGTYGLPFVPSLLLGTLSGAGAAVLLGLPALRIRGMFLAVTTVGFSVVVSSVVLSGSYFGWLLPEHVNRPQVLFVKFADERAFYYLCLTFAALTVVAALGLRRSRTGRVLIAMRDNERAAQAFGINLVRVRLVTFAISGAMAAFAGGLFSYHQGAVRQQEFLPDESVRMFLMTVIGGLGNVGGVLLGPIYIGLMHTLLAAYEQLAGGGGVILVMLFMPGGLGAAAFFLRDSFLRRVAIRHKIFVPSLLADHRAEHGMTKVPIVPKEDGDGNRLAVPIRFRLPSRIGVAGSSQTARPWIGS